jgi:hypothetical protein
MPRYVSKLKSWSGGYQLSAAKRVNSKKRKLLMPVRRFEIMHVMDVATEKRMPGLQNEPIGCVERMLA